MTLSKGPQVRFDRSLFNMDIALKIIVQLLINKNVESYKCCVYNVQKNCVNKDFQTHSTSLGVVFTIVVSELWPSLLLMRPPAVCAPTMTYNNKQWDYSMYDRNFIV